MQGNKDGSVDGFAEELILTQTPSGLLPFVLQPFFGWGWFKISGCINCIFNMLFGWKTCVSLGNPLVVYSCLG